MPTRLRATAETAEYRRHLLAALLAILGRRCRRCSVRRCAKPEPSGCHALIQIESARRRTGRSSGIGGSGNVVLVTRCIGGCDSAWRKTVCSGRNRSRNASLHARRILPVWVLRAPHEWYSTYPHRVRMRVPCMLLCALCVATSPVAASSVSQVVLTGYSVVLTRYSPRGG